MPIAVVCPGCAAKLNAPDATAGKTVKCPKCKEPLAVPAESPAPQFEVVDEPVPPKPAKPKPVKKSDVVLDDEDDDDDEDMEERPKKKKGKKKPAAAGLSPAVIAAIVGGALLLGGGAFVAYWFGIREPEAKPMTSNTPQMPSNPGLPPGGMAPPPPGGGPNVPGPNVPGPKPAGGGAATMPTPNTPSGPVKALYEEKHPAGPVYRAASANNLKMIAIAHHNAVSAYGSGFPAGIYDSNGNVGLSWRVAILPFIEQDSLYRQFKLNEPWDSEHNKKLIPLMPKTYAAPGADPKKGLTHYRSFSGANTMFPPPPRGTPGQLAFGLKMFDVPDGLSNTAMIAEAGDAVEWTKPDELVVSSGSLPRLGGIFADNFAVVLGDGSVRRLKIDTPADKLKAMITPRGGETIDFNNE